MTGLETMIAKVSNATAQAMMGNRPVLARDSWELEEMRREALEREERRFEAMRRENRGPIRWAND